MSEPSDREEDYISSTLENLREFEDQILSRKELIKVVLDQEVEKHPTNTNRKNLISGLSTSLQFEIDDAEKANEVAESLYYFLIISTNDRWEEKIANGSADELLEFLNQLRQTYQMGVTGLYLENTQGKHYWTNIQTDFVIREPDERVGLNHSIRIADEKEIELTTSLSSNLALINSLLEKQNRAHEVFGAAALNEINEDAIDSIAQVVNDIQQKIKTTPETTPNDEEEG